MKKPKKFTREFDLSEFGEGNFILRITESRAEVETKVKNWKVMFGSSFFTYIIIGFKIYTKITIYF